MKLQLGKNACRNGTVKIRKLFKARCLRRAPMDSKGWLESAWDCFLRTPWRKKNKSLSLGTALVPAEFKVWRISPLKQNTRVWLQFVAGLKATSSFRGSPFCELVLVTFSDIMGPKEVKGFISEGKIKERWWPHLGILTWTFRGHLVTALLQ